MTGGNVNDGIGCDELGPVVDVGQVWEQLDKRRAKLVEVMGVSHPCGVVWVRNMATDRHTFVALRRMRPHTNWRRVS